MADLENFDLEKFEQEVFSEIHEVEKILKQESGTKRIVRVELNGGAEVVTTIQHKKIELPSPKVSPVFNIINKPVFMFALGVIVGIVVTILVLLSSGLSREGIVQFLISLFKPPLIFGVLTSVAVIFTSTFIVRKQTDKKRRENRKRAEVLRQRATEEAAKQRLARLSEIHRSFDEAEKIVNNRDIRRLLCPALLSITNDAFEYSKVITPILAGAVIAKTIVLPLDSALFAAISIVAARCGASVICANYTAKK